MIKYTVAELYALLVRAHLQNIYRLYPSLHWLLKAHYHVIVASTSVDPSLPNIYKEEIDVFSNELASILP